MCDAWLRNDFSCHGIAMTEFLGTTARANACSRGGSLSAAAARTPCPELDRHHAPAPRRRPRQNAAAMPMLRSAHRQTITTPEICDAVR